MSLQDFLSHLSEILDMPVADVQPGAKLADLEGWNSMAMVSFIAFVDEYFEKTVPVRVIASCQTIADLAALSGIGA
jgi:acyl carrier protein